MREQDVGLQPTHQTQQLWKSVANARCSQIVNRNIRWDLLEERPGILYEGQLGLESLPR